MFSYSMFVMMCTLCV